VSLRIIAVGVAIAALVALTGCSSKEAVSPKNVAPHLLTSETALQRGRTGNNQEFKPAEQKITPSIGSRNRASRIILDNGVVLKIWMPSYITPDNVLHGASEIYVRVEEPQWVVGEPTPVRSKSALSPSGSFPFAFRPDELDPLSSPADDENVAAYQRGVQESLRSQEFRDKKDEDTASDAKILDFLNKERARGKQ
jgi:hypothetical protein